MSVPNHSDSENSGQNKLGDEVIPAKAESSGLPTHLISQDDASPSGVDHPLPPKKSANPIIRVLTECFVALALLVVIITGAWMYAQNSSSRTEQSRDSKETDLPLISLDESLLDLGNVALDDGEVMPVSFHFQNLGQAPLEILEIVSSCSCTEATASPKVVQPNGTGQINVQVRRSQLGPGSAKLRITTNDPAHRDLELRCQWNGIARLQFNETVLDFGEVNPGKSKERDLKLTFQDRARYPSCSVVKFEASPGITIEPRSMAQLNKPLADESHYQIVLEGTRQSGPGNGVLRFHFEGCYKEEFVIPVSWTVRSRIQATPQQLFLDSGLPGQILKKKLVLTTLAPDRLTIHSVRLTPEGIGTLELKQVSEVCQTIDVAVPLTNQQQTLQGAVILECTEPVKETIEVPWSAVKLQGTQD